jgi:hypothetical protein
MEEMRNWAVMAVGILTSERHLSGCLGLNLLCFLRLVFLQDGKSAMEKMKAYDLRDQTTQVHSLGTL